MLYTSLVKALVIIAKDGYQDMEYAGTRKGLDSAGCDVTVASTAVGMCKGKLGGSEQATMSLNEVNVSDYDIVAFIGGPGAAPLADDREAQRIAREAVEQGKRLGAICIAPTILAKAGVLRGKKATTWDSGGEQVNLLKQCGATYTGQAVTVDGDIVTANGPEAAEEFGRKLVA